MQFQEYVCYGDHSADEAAMYDYSMEHPETFADCDPSAVLQGLFPTFIGIDLG